MVSGQESSRSGSDRSATLRITASGNLIRVLIDYFVLHNFGFLTGCLLLLPFFRTIATEQPVFFSKIIIFVTYRTYESLCITYEINQTTDLSLVGFTHSYHLLGHVLRISPGLRPTLRRQYRLVRIHAPFIDSGHTVSAFLHQLFYSDTPVSLPERHDQISCHQSHVDIDGRIRNTLVQRGTPASHAGSSSRPSVTSTFPFLPA